MRLYCRHGEKGTAPEGFDRVYTEVDGSGNALRELFAYHNGFYALVSYIMSEKAKGAAHSLPQQPPQPAIPASKIEKRYQQMRQGTVKPRFRSDVPTERLKELRKKGYSYERIAQETGLSKSAVIYRLK